MSLLNPEHRQTALIEARNVGRIVSTVIEFLVTGRKTASAMAAYWGKNNPNGLAVMYEDEQYTWKQLNTQVNKYANWFRAQGLKKGSVVALMMDNRPDYLFITLALSRIQAIGALINTNLTGKALEHAINIAKPDKVLAGSEYATPVNEIFKQLETVGENDFWIQLDTEDKAPKAGTVINGDIEESTDATPPQLEKPTKDDHFCYIYTSGTTGLPKAALVTNNRLFVAGIVFGRTMIEGSPDDVIYVPLPLYHSSGMYIGWGSALVTGAAVALRRKFSASNFVADLHKFGATSFLFIGELCRYLLNTPEQPGEKTHNVKVCVGNGLRPDIWEEFQRRFNIPVVHEFYGATEGTAAILNFEGRPGMIGRLRQGQLVVKCDLESGEVIRNAKGLCTEVGEGETGLLLGQISKLVKFDGYLDEKATSKKVLNDVLKRGDEYFNTGDLVTVHENKWLSFADRVGDTFRWKGENVSTNEVAEIINGADGILESNVYGVRVPHTDGRAGMAALTVDKRFNLKKFAGYVKENLTNYQKPYFIRVLEPDSMRITGTFKHQKVDYRNEAFDPEKVQDKLYYLEDDTYVPLTKELYTKIEKGDVTPG